MSSLNRATIIGNLGRDPESRRTNSGALVVNLSVATTEKWKDKASGQPRESTEWHRVTLFGSLAEIAEKYLRKGSKVYLEGQLQTRKWTDKSGAERYSTEVVLQNYGGKLVMLDSKGERQDEPARQEPAAAPSDNPGSEIPF